MPTGRAILIDDAPRDLSLISQAVRDEFPKLKVEEYDDPRQFWGTFGERLNFGRLGVDFIVTDLYMLGGYSDAVDLAKRLKEPHWSLRRALSTSGHPAPRNIPVIAFSKFVPAFRDAIVRSEDPDHPSSDSAEQEAVLTVSKELDSTLSFLEAKGIDLIQKRFGDDGESLQRLVAAIRRTLNRAEA